MLTALVAEMAGQRVSDRLIPVLHHGGRPYIASFAPAVFRGRALGDWACIEIFERQSALMADLTYPAERVRDLMAPVIEGRADMVVGDRHSAGHYASENKRALHGFGNGLVRNLVNGLFNASLADIMSGYRVFSRRFVKNYPILVEGFEIETDVTLHALDKRFRIVEIPVEYVDRPQGSVSKLNTVGDGARVLFVILQILRYYRPMAFFGSLSLLFGLAGLFAAVPVIQDWIVARYISHVPLAILATGFEIVAVVTLAVGLILDSIVYQQRRDYERQILNFGR